ncbi:MAG: nicotinamide-nucleotide amidohydrolase family protein, partial [Pseudomonadota bacterium]
MFEPELIEKAQEFLALCKEQNIKIVTAESCTGGLLAGLFTEIAGSSAVFDRGFITYSNQAKHDLLGVGQELLDNYGAVSRQVAEAMAQGAL